MKSTISFFLLSLCSASLTDLSGTESVVDSLTNMLGTSNPITSEFDKLDDLEAPVKESENDLFDETENVVIKEIELETPKTSELKVKPVKESYDEESAYSTDDESLEGYNEKYYNKKGDLKHHKGKMSYYDGKKGHHKGKHYMKGHESGFDFESESESEGLYNGVRSNYNRRGNYEASRLYKRNDWNKKSYYSDWSDEQNLSDDDVHKGHKSEFGNHKDHRDEYMTYNSDKSGYENDNHWDGYMGHKDGYESDDYSNGLKGYEAGINGYRNSKNNWDNHMDHKGDYGSTMDGYSGEKLYRRDYYKNGPWISSPRNYRRDYYNNPREIGFRNYRRNYYHSRGNFAPNYNY